MKQFINYDEMVETLQKLFTDSLSEEDAQKYESIIEEYANIHAEIIVEDMKKYVHQKDTKLSGNFCNIREDWEYCPEFIGSEIKPWGKFSDIVKSMDDETISDEDLAKVQTWCKDWFFRAFETWGLTYNFHELISEMEYEEEHANAA